MKVSIIIPVWNGRKYLKACLDALLAQDSPDFQVIAVDNASSDDSADFVAEEYPQVHLIRNERNLGFAGGCNVGLRAAQGDVLVLLNQDTVVQPGWLKALVDALDDPDVGIAGCKILEADGVTLSHCGGSLDLVAAQTQHYGAGELDRGQYDKAVDVDYVTGAAFAVRRDVLDHVGLMDERFFPGYYEDTDFCLRARKAGFRIQYVPDAVVIHHVSASTRQHWVRRRFYYYRNRLLFLFKHLSPSQILAEFIPAERERVLLLPQGELRAGRVALTEILAMWPLVARELLASANTSGDVENLLDALRMSRGSIARQQGSDSAFSIPLPGKARGSEAVIDQHGLTNALTDELEALWEVREHPFSSPVPIIGPWIVAFRNLWNSVATRWYVRPLLSQQVQFNGALVRALTKFDAQYQNLNAHYWDNDALLALLAERCGMLTARITELESRLAQLELLGEDEHE